jgi:hypothetical protein
VAGGGGVVQHVVDQLRGGGGLAARGGRVDGEQADVRIRRHLRVDGISQPALLAHLLEQARRCAAADNVAEEAGGEIVRREHRRGGRGEREMRLLGLGAADRGAAGEAAGSGSAIAPGVRSAKCCSASATTCA